MQLTRKEAHRRKANARHEAPQGARSIQYDRLLADTPKKYHVNDDYYLNRRSSFFRAGMSNHVAAYAGGAYINTLPKSKAHNRF